MAVHFNNPELQTRIDQLVTLTGVSADELVETVMRGYLDEVAQVRNTLDSRYDDIKSGKVQPIDGEAFFESLTRRGTSPKFGDSSPKIISAPPGACGKKP